MTFQDLDNWRHYLADEIFPNGKERIRVCTGTACLASGAKAVIEGIEAEIKQKGRDVEVTKTGCQGLCQKGPLVQIDPQGYFYQRVRRSDAADLVTNALSSGSPIRHLLYRDSGMSEPCERLSQFRSTRSRTGLYLETTVVLIRQTFGTILPGADIPPWKRRFMP